MRPKSASALRHPLGEQHSRQPVLTAMLVNSACCSYHDPVMLSIKAQPGASWLLCQTGVLLSRAHPHFRTSCSLFTCCMQELLGLCSQCAHHAGQHAAHYSPPCNSLRLSACIMPQLIAQRMAHPACLKCRAHPMAALLGCKTSGACTLCAQVACTEPKQSDLFFKETMLGGVLGTALDSGWLPIAALAACRDQQLITFLMSKQHH